MSIAHSNCPHAARRRPLFESHPAARVIRRKDGMLDGDTWIDPHDPMTWACAHHDDVWPGHTIYYEVYDGSRDAVEEPITRYIGITDNIARRFTQHRAAKPWWPTLDQAMLTCFVSREAAACFEAYSLSTGTGFFNVQRPRHELDPVGP